MCPRCTPKMTVLYPIGYEPVAVKPDQGEQPYSYRFEAGRRLSVARVVLQALVGLLDVHTHGGLGVGSPALRQRSDELGVLRAGFLGDFAVETQPEDMQVGMQPGEGVAHQRIATAFGDEIVQFGIL